MPSSNSRSSRLSRRGITLLYPRPVFRRARLSARRAPRRAASILLPLRRQRQQCRPAFPYRRRLHLGGPAPGARSAASSSSHKRSFARVCRTAASRERARMASLPPLPLLWSGGSQAGERPRCLRWMSTSADQKLAQPAYPRSSPSMLARAAQLRATSCSACRCSFLRPSSSLRLLWRVEHGVASGAKLFPQRALVARSDNSLASACHLA